MTFRGDGARVAHPLFQAGDDGSTPISPLDLTLYEIDMRRAQKLNATWHSVLPQTDLGTISIGHSVAYSAEFNGLSYGVAIWSDPIARALANGKTIELRRLAVAPDAPKNTASRMLAVMVRLLRAKFADIEKAISYQAVDVHNGTIYKAAGWEPMPVRKFAKWSDRKTRTRGGKFLHASSTRKPPQITSDKRRWEKMVRPAGSGLSPT